MVFLIFDTNVVSNLGFLSFLRILHKKVLFDENILYNLVPYFCLGIEQHTINYKICYSTYFRSTDINLRFVFVCTTLNQNVFEY